MLGIISNKRGGAASSINLRPMQVEMAPKRPFYAIGDVHGCLDQMFAALGRVDDDIEANEIDDPTLVFLGDYVDRGKASAEVLDFLDKPLKVGPRWLRYGGVETLESYGIAGIDKDASDEQLYEACEELWDAFPEGLEPWLRKLPLRWSTGNLHCVHAALDPAQTVLQQSQDVMLWGCDSFMKTARTDGNWVIHGHTVVEKPVWEHSRVSLDTGCYFTGELTAAAFTNNACRII